MSEYNEMDVAERLKVIINSYVSKEEFLTILEQINFKAIENCNLDLITDFVYNSREDKIEKRSKNISIS